MNYWGNQDLLKLSKTAFLCSQRCPAAVVLRSYDWAKAQREAGHCIACGNHSPIEKDVFQILLRGSQPLILVLARGLKTRWEPDIVQAVHHNRLLVASPFDPSTKRVTRNTAQRRNEALISLSSRITVGYVTPRGQLDKLLTGRNYQQI